APLTFFNPLNLNSTGSAVSRTVEVDANVATLNGVMSNSNGAATLVKTGAGILVLPGANTLSGGVKISGGTVRIFNDGNLGAVPGGPVDNVILDGGTLQFGDDTEINGNRIFAITANGGMIDTNGKSPLYGCSLAFRAPGGPPTPGG